MQRVEQRSKVYEDATFLVQGGGVEWPALKNLQPGLRKLERAAGWQLAKEDIAAGRRKTRGRHWQPPRSDTVTPSSSGTKGRHWLESEVRQCGLTAREAHAVTAAILAAIKEGLQRDAEVETPLGKFFLMRRTAPYQRKRWGSNQNLHQHGTRVAFRSDPGLIVEGESKQMTTPAKQDNWEQCPACGSTFFQEVEVRQYVVSPAVLPGGGLHPSDHRRQVKICLCGHLLPVNFVGRMDEEGRSLQESLQRARQYRANLEPDQILADLARDFVTRSELQTLAEHLDQLQTLLQPPHKDDPAPNAAD